MSTAADLVVREARAEDAEGFVAAHEAAWNATIGVLLDSTLEELAPLAQRLAGYREGIERSPANARAWLAERSGEIVGIAVSVRGTPRSVELRDLYVVPGAWGTGVASTLLRAAIDSVGVDAEEAFLWVGEENVRARRFYEREGWSTDGASRASPLGPSELRYRRPLPFSRRS